MTTKKLSRWVAMGLALTVAFLTMTSVAMAAAKPAPTGKININAASADQLTALPGVGQKLAARIVDYRQKSGGFKSPQELLNVQGIGEKSFLKLQPYLSTGEVAKGGASH